MQKSTKNIIIILIIIIILALIIYFVSDYQRGKTGLKGPVRTEEGMVKSPLGEFNPEKPEITGSLEEVPSGAITIQLERGNLKPQEFTVQQGKVVPLVLIGLDGTHGLTFEDKGLKEIKIYVGKGEKRGISFLAPGPGNYTFSCPVLGHNETGIMHVK